MQRMVDPRQTRLFDPYEPVLTAKNRPWLEENWPGVFRHVILELMPVDALREHFHPAGPADPGAVLPGRLAPAEGMA